MRSTDLHIDTTTPRPNFFIVGAPKCGTTSLYHYLSAHPEVFMSQRKEPRFFGRDFDMPERRCVTTLEEYLRLFRGAERYKRIGEASTAYLRSALAASQIKAFAPDAKIVVSLRNPVDFMWSLHGEYVAGGWETITDFEEALAAQPDRLRGERLHKHLGGPKYFQYGALATFSTQLEAYFEAFGRENVLVLLLEELKADPREAYLRITRFLEISESFLPDFGLHNEARWARTSMRAKNLLRMHPVIERQLRLLPRGARTRLVKLFGRLLAHHAPTRPTAMPSSLRERLEMEFSEEVKRLGCLLGRDLTRWTDGNRSRADDSTAAAAHSLSSSS